MALFTHQAFDGHEQVVFCHDPAVGLRAIIAIHNTSRGPALGGCRMWPYPSDGEALTDVLRLSRGMTYKAAMAGLDFGGGKSVIIGDPARDKSAQLMRTMGRFVDGLGGRYIAAEDVGTSVSDLRQMAQITRFVAGVAERRDSAFGADDGDPSPATAYGIFVGIKAAVRFALGRDDLDSIRVAVQGLGHVGQRLARHLKAAGARLWVSDLSTETTRHVAEELEAMPVSPEEILAQDVDVFAPCALGAVIDDDAIARLRAPIVAGAANNQLAEPRHDEVLRRRGVLYAPDYVINAGGIIDIAFEHDPTIARHRVEAIAQTLTGIFERAASSGQGPGAVADRLAEARFRAPPRRAHHVA